MPGIGALNRAACVILLAALAAPAEANIIASFDFQIQNRFSGFSSVQIYAPSYSFFVNGVSILSVVPANGNNFFNLSGVGLDLMASALSNGYPDEYDSKLTLDSIDDSFGLTLLFSENSFIGAANLPGATIRGIRISVLDLCMQPSAIGNCPLVGPGLIGFSGELLIAVSDSPFSRGVPEPTSPSLLCAALAALYIVRRRSTLAAAATPMSYSSMPKPRKRAGVLLGWRWTPSIT